MAYVNSTTFKIIKMTASIIQELYGNGNINRAVLASIRGASSMTSPRAQNVWPIMMEKLDPAMLSRTGKPTRAEIAVYSALRFYAIHQQGKEPLVAGISGKDETADGIMLFAALANLRKNDDTRTALDRRVQALFGTTNISSVINSITHLVEILKATTPNQKIDYARLAGDLYRYQGSYQQARQVSLAWAQQYYRYIKQPVASAEGEKNND